MQYFSNTLKQILCLKCQNLFTIQDWKKKYFPWNDPFNKVLGKRSGGSGKRDLIGRPLSRQGLLPEERREDGQRASWVNDSARTSPKGRETVSLTCHSQLSHNHLG